MASSLCSMSFERDARRPTRVNNESKACLDDITLTLQRSINTKLALVGNEDAEEQKIDAKQAKSRHPQPSRAAKRAVNTKDYLVIDKGIDASRILVYTGTDDEKTVTTTLIPVGATNPVAGNTTVDESTIKVEGRKPIQETSSIAPSKRLTGRKATHAGSRSRKRLSTPSSLVRKRPRSTTSSS